MIRPGYFFLSESFFRPLIAMKKEMGLIKTFIESFLVWFVHVETKNVSDRATTSIQEASSLKTNVRYTGLSVAFIGNHIICLRQRIR